MLFGEVDPRRAARGEGRALLLLEVAEQFGAFLHDHDVGAEVGIEDHVGAELTQRGDDLPLDVGSRWQAEFLAEADADRRRRLEDGDDVRVGQVVEHFLRLVALGQRAGRADHHALPAGDARRGVDRAALETNTGGVAPTRKFERIDVLDLAADGDAARAADAATAIVDDRLAASLGRQILPAFRVAKAYLLQADRVGRDQQLAAPGARAGGAVLAMVGHRHFHLQLAHFLDLVRPGQHVPALDHRGVAGRHVARRSGVAGAHFNEADAAGTRRMIDVVQFAERRNVDVVAARNVEDRFVGLEFELAAVDVGVHG